MLSNYWSIESWAKDWLKIRKTTKMTNGNFAFLEKKKVKNLITASSKT